MEINNNTWVIFCMSNSIKDRIQELSDLFKDHPNTICVNNARYYFPGEYWCFVDRPTKKEFYQTDKKIVTTIRNYNRLGFLDKSIKVHEIFNEPCSNSGIYAIQYAKKKGATSIITCGFDLSYDWGKLDNSSLKPSRNYVQLMRDEFKRRCNYKNCPIYTVNRFNELGLKYLDTNSL